MSVTRHQNIIITSVRDQHSSSGASILYHSLPDSELLIIFPDRVIDTLSSIFHQNPGSNVYMSGIDPAGNSMKLIEAIASGACSGNSVVWYTHGTDLSFIDSRNISNLSIKNCQENIAVFLANQLNNHELCAKIKSLNGKTLSLTPAIILITALRFQKSISDFLPALERIITLPPGYLNQDLYQSFFNQSCLNLFLSGQQEQISQLRKKLFSAGVFPCNVLLYGEAGTGHDAASLMIHLSGSRYTRPFLELSCATLDESSLETEIFGFDSQYGTQIQNRTGVLEKANGGTVLLKEIDHLSERLQYRLLSFLDEQSFRRINGTKKICSDIQLITTITSSEDSVLKRLIPEIRYSLCENLICLPALRDIRNDVYGITDEICLRFSRSGNLANLFLDDIFFDKIKNHTWPGNIRELCSYVKKSVFSGFWQEIADSNIAEQKKHISVESCSVSKTLEEYKMDIVRDCYLKNSNNKAHTAKELGITLNTLKSFLKKAGLS